MPPRALPSHSIGHLPKVHLIRQFSLSHGSFFPTNTSSDPTSVCVANTAYIHSFLTGTGSAIWESLYPLLASTEKELLIVTCFWARSDSLNILNKLLRELSQRALDNRGEATGSDPDQWKICVRINISSRSALQKMVQTGKPEGYVYQQNEWHRKLGLPKPKELTGLDLQVKSVFHRPFSVLHPKFMVVDRKMVVLPSCNVSWEEWAEGAVVLSGEGLVKSILAFYGQVWDAGFKDHRGPNLYWVESMPWNLGECKIRHAGGPASAPEGTADVTGKGKDPYKAPDLNSTHLSMVFGSKREGYVATTGIAVPVLLLPSSHHRNPVPQLFKPKAKRTYEYPLTPLNCFIISCLNAAKHSIEIVTPNLTCQPVLDALLDALKRGVSVHVRTCEGMMTLEQVGTALKTTKHCVKRLIRKYRKYANAYHASPHPPTSAAPGALKVEFWLNKKLEGPTGPEPPPEVVEDMSGRVSPADSAKAQLDALREFYPWEKYRPGENMSWVWEQDALDVCRGEKDRRQEGGEAKGEIVKLGPDPEDTYDQLRAGARPWDLANSRVSTLPPGIEIGEGSRSGVGARPSSPVDSKFATVPPRVESGEESSSGDGARPSNTADSKVVTVPPHVDSGEGSSFGVASPKLAGMLLGLPSELLEPLPHLTHIRAMPVVFRSHDEPQDPRDNGTRNNYTRINGTGDNETGNTGTQGSSTNSSQLTWLAPLRPSDYAGTLASSTDSSEAYYSPYPPPRASNNSPASPFARPAAGPSALGSLTDGVGRGSLRGGVGARQPLSLGSGHTGYAQGTDHQRLGHPPGINPPPGLTTLPSGSAAGPSRIGASTYFSGRSAPHDASSGPDFSAGRLRGFARAAAVSRNRGPEPGPASSSHRPQGNDSYAQQVQDLARDASVSWNRGLRPGPGPSSHRPRDSASSSNNFYAQQVQDLARDAPALRNRRHLGSSLGGTEGRALREYASLPGLRDLPGSSMGGPEDRISRGSANRPLRNSTSFSSEDLHQQDSGPYSNFHWATQQVVRRQNLPESMSHDPRRRRLFHTPWRGRDSAVQDQGTNAYRGLPSDASQTLPPRGAASQGGHSGQRSHGSSRPNPEEREDGRPGTSASRGGRSGRRSRGSSRCNTRRGPSSPTGGPRLRGGAGDESDVPPQEDPDSTTAVPLQKHPDITTAGPAPVAPQPLPVPPRSASIPHPPPNSPSPVRHPPPSPAPPSHPPPNRPPPVRHPPPNRPAPVPPPPNRPPPEDPDAITPAPPLREAPEVHALPPRITPLLYNQNNLPAPNQSHLKMTVVDDEVVILGSGNMDRASFHTSQELGIAIVDRNVVKGMKRVVDNIWEGRSKVVFDSEGP